MVPVMFEVVPLAGAFHAGMFPVPLVSIPMEVLLLVHEYVNPGMLLEKAGMLIASPGQTLILDIALTDGVGYIVTVKLMGVPGQLYGDNGVTVMVPVIFAPVVFVGAFHAGMLPEPEAPSPITVLLFAQVYVVPGILDVNAGMLIKSPGHTAIALMGFIIGVGCMVTVKLIGVPSQLCSEVGVTVMVPVISAPEEFVGAVHEGIFPVPEETSPMAVLSFTHV